ncbi:uncharacterized protein V1518DRAFT_409926 [Limtongia smithiae]|uniref:uncharacterized protein n=1 Tax=Limtongia smithiae TaxID=1125753 RepID=UPI0034CE4477
MAARRRQHIYSALSPTTRLYRRTLLRRRPSPPRAFACLPPLLGSATAPPPLPRALGTMMVNPLPSFTHTYGRGGSGAPMQAYGQPSQPSPDSFSRLGAPPSQLPPQQRPLSAQQHPSYAQQSLPSYYSESAYGAPSPLEPPQHGAHSIHYPIPHQLSSAQSAYPPSPRASMYAPAPYASSPYSSHYPPPPSGHGEPTHSPASHSQQLPPLHMHHMRQATAQAAPPSAHPGMAPQYYGGPSQPVHAQQPHIYSVASIAQPSLMNHAGSVATAMSEVSAHKPAKEIKRRTKTGCLTCRKRRIKCDERHPVCFNCSKSKRVCLGYDPSSKSQKSGKRDDGLPSESPGIAAPQIPVTSVVTSSVAPASSKPSSDQDTKRIKIDSLLSGS